MILELGESTWSCVESLCSDPLVCAEDSLTDFGNVKNEISLVETCGPPQIQNTMLNQTKNPGESVHFRCQVNFPRKLISSHYTSLSRSTCQNVWWLLSTGTTTVWTAQSGGKWRWEGDGTFCRHFIKFLLFLLSERERRRPAHPPDLPSECGPRGALHLCRRQRWDSGLGHDLSFRHF